ncbi:hypothetical protein SAMN05660772_02028 [Pasteurella testudinis DSM 23072]|uniref:Uncharacterized protein n=1 Tax=Pasteurella testudinis DSM 23072 TaxID=1122938 RepID=A0A1W1UMB0_9PAST|nr:DUF5339 domain-containing protein [Pasteurella testudinis]SMB82217.1 hypothetical protein SAMN05660772_02028 [Pasteurella testudinis DSM 23072]SUB52336.1 Uncharacterised protein [Pasteurella testudinis]
MLKKIIRSLALAGFISFSLTAVATASTSTSQASKSNLEKSSIPQQCNQLFSETEQLIKEAEKQPGTHTQFANIKNKLSQSKKQILALEREVQVKSCDKGLVALNNIKKQQIQP